jgi:disulfide oxidoreductase YuzD
MKRIKKSDLSYPLIIIEDDYDNKGVILDGNHRFAKIIMEHKKEVKYYFITKKELKKLKIKLD